MRLIYEVTVDSGDRENDAAYLKIVQQTFRLITEELSSFGFAGELFCSSRFQAQRPTNVQHQT